MKGLDSATWVGIIIALGCILVGNQLEGGHFSSVIQPTAMLIVGGGTLGAVMVSFPMSTMKEALHASKRFFGNEESDTPALLDQFQRLAQLARKEGLLALENELKSVEDPFLRKALSMLVDGTDSKTLEQNLDLEIGAFETHGEQPAKVWEAGGGYAPTIGIIGAVLGLIHVMANLSDIEKVGTGIAVAFVATIYGVGLANIVFLPAANKLKLKHHDDVQRREMIKLGAMGILEGTNPRLLRDRLMPFVHGHHAEHEEAGGAAPAKKAA